MMTKTLALGLIWAFLVIERQCDAAILNPMPPKGGKQIALAHLKDAVTNPGFTLGQRPDFLRLPINEMVLSEPHQTYHANLTNVATGSLLSKARLFSWRYLVLHAHKGVAEVELNANEKSGAIFRFLSLSDGHYADATLAALRQADTSPEFRGRDYQLRLLKVPALHLVAVWLQRDSEDVLIPLSPAPRGLTVNRAYSEAEIVEVLIPLAKQTIISSEKPGTPEGFSVRKHE